MKLTLILICSLLSLTGRCQLSTLSDTKLDFEEMQADSLTVKMDSILLLGAGASVSRILLNDLSDKLIKDFKARNIYAAYFYLGKNTDDARHEFDMMKDKSGYKAILLFLPKDTIFNLEYDYYSYNQNSGSPAIASSPRMYSLQMFSLQLYTTQEAMKKIWTASVTVDFNPGKKTAAKRIAKKILYSFKKNKYLE